ncbi:hypothetical protein JG687_00016493 [Phytophthora cactorum]|uniref:Uncharacterized protein n=1 Tax=Phytophthora cactorum TaxID=29920 RepID=A0A329RKR4_9STRA|nr:hypothetical protein PC120_g17518 [Phytophthora cactorum]KAG6946830.1 hypothetical protein JG687_00016493 [Phytophthora cactorum]RAW23922.1 hypothetical protein PC110_g19650 [Phytophthora cactorum]
MAKRKREEIAVRRTRGCGYLEVLALWMKDMWAPFISGIGCVVAFKEAWTLLRKCGWYSKPPPRHSLNPCYRYFRPCGDPDGQIGVDYLLGEIAVLPYARVTTANNESVHVDDSTARAELPPAWAVTQPVASMAAPGTRVGEGAAGPPREGSLRYRGSSHNEVTVEGGGGSEGIAGSKSPPIIAAIKRPGKT